MLSAFKKQLIAALKESIPQQTQLEFLGIAGIAEKQIS